MKRFSEPELLGFETKPWDVPVVGDRAGAVLDRRASIMSKGSQTGDATGASGVALGNISQIVKNSPKLRVLVVDDEPLIRWSLAETLEQSGHAVAEAGDAGSAIRAVSAGEPFDVVLLDYRLPDSNDLNLLATIRKLAPASAIIMMTAFGTPEVMAGALKLGAYQVILKPFEVHEVAALVLEAHVAPR